MTQDNKENEVVRVGESANKFPGSDPIQPPGLSPTALDRLDEIRKDSPSFQREQAVGHSPILPNFPSLAPNAGNVIQGVVRPIPSGVLPEVAARLADLNQRAKAATESVVTSVVPVVSAEETSLMNKTQDVLKEYGNLEGNIPIHHDYWVFVRQLRALRAPKF